MQYILIQKAFYILLYANRRKLYLKEKNSFARLRLRSQLYYNKIQYETKLKILMRLRTYRQEFNSKIDYYQRMITDFLHLVKREPVLIEDLSQHVDCYILYCFSTFLFISIPTYI